VILRLFGAPACEMEMQFRLKHSLKKIFSRVFANGTSKANRGLAFEVTMLLFKAHHGHEQCHYLNMNYIWGDSKGYPSRTAKRTASAEINCAPAYFCGCKRLFSAILV